MIKTDDDIVNDHAPYVADKVRGKLLIFSSDKNDAVLTNQLLSSFGFSAEWHSSLSTYIDASSRLSLKNRSYVATVVFYRNSTNRIQDLYLLKRLPGKRIIVISDCTLESTVVSSLSNGAHHYFNSQESLIVMQARLEAALRNQIRPAKRSLRVDDMYFDVTTRRVKHVDKWVELSPKEFDLAEYMFSNPGRLVTNNELLTSVWSLPIGVDSRRIDTAACRLRKKLKLGKGDRWELKKIRLVGYRLIRAEQQLVNIVIPPKRYHADLNAVI